MSTTIQDICVSVQRQVMGVLNANESSTSACQEILSLLKSSLDAKCVPYDNFDLERGVQKFFGVTSRFSPIYREIVSAESLASPETFSQSLATIVPALSKLLTPSELTNGAAILRVFEIFDMVQNDTINARLVGEILASYVVKAIGGRLSSVTTICDSKLPGTGAVASVVQKKISVERIRPAESPDTTPATSPQAENKTYQEVIATTKSEQQKKKPQTVVAAKTRDGDVDTSEDTILVRKDREDKDPKELIVGKDCLNTPALRTEERYAAYERCKKIGNWPHCNTCSFVHVASNTTVSVWNGKTSVFEEIPVSTIANNAALKRIYAFEECKFALCTLEKKCTRGEKCDFVHLK